MSYCPDNRVINFRSRQPFECGRPRGSSWAELCGDDVGVNIFIMTTLVALVRQVRRERRDFFLSLDCLPFSSSSRLGGCQDREANLRLLWTASSLSYLFPFFCSFPFTLNSFKSVQAWSKHVVRRIRVFSRSYLRWRIHEMHETVIRKLAFLIV